MCLGHAPADRPCPELSLTAYTSNKQWLVLGFVPMAWTFVCPTEILAFSERAADFAARGASVVFASTDSEYSLLAWTNASKRDGGLGKINIPLLSDKNHQISKDYGVLIEDEGVALRGLFLIDPSGIVRQITINDLSVGRSVDETLRLIDAFQFTDKYGEVCTWPAAWPQPCICGCPSADCNALGLPCQLEPRRRDDQGDAPGQQGVSRQGACRHQDGRRCAQDQR